MNRLLKNTIFAGLLFSGSLALVAAPIDDAKKLYREGDYAAALEKLQVLKKKSPKDGTVNYYLGASLVALGRNDEAVAPLKQAASRGVADASRLLAEYAAEQYRVDDADEHLDAWAAQLKKSKKDIPESHERLSSRVLQLRNMLDRVEKIEVIDSLSVDSASFFRAYRLSEAAGRILAPDILGSIGAGEGASELSVAYVPENRTELLWAATDENGTFELFGADILDDGTLDHTTPLGKNLGEGGNAKFPFLMPDGVTLYFANDGENSLGGYDIFMTRRTDGDAGERSYFQPQNIGMPYNSPFNDYMLAIDEASGLGWWATDRNAEPGKVTVYVFIPSAMRVNASPDDPALLDLARMSSIALTQKEGVDYDLILEQRMPAQTDNAEKRSNSSPVFAIDNGKGKVYTSLSDFANDRARSTMLESLAAEAELRKLSERLDGLREKWRRGDHSVGHEIRNAEEQEARTRKNIANLRNTALRLESSR